VIGASLVVVLVIAWVAFALLRSLPAPRLELSVPVMSRIGQRQPVRAAGSLSSSPDLDELRGRDQRARRDTVEDVIEPWDVTVGGVRLACFIGGDIENPPLVLLHALGEDATTWEPIWTDLESRFRIIAIDMRGHGKSDWPGEYSFELMRDDVLGLVDELGIERFTLLGHSMGASVAYLIAEEHPSRVDRLVIEDAPPPYPQERRPVPDRPEGPLSFDWPVVPAIRAQVDEPDSRYWNLLGEITAPTFIVAGGSDSHVSQEKIAEAVERISDATMVTISAGHLVHETRPEEFLDALFGWLATTK